MVETIGCWYLPGNQTIPGFVWWCRISSIHGIFIASKGSVPQMSYRIHRCKRLTRQLDRRFRLRSSAFRRRRLGRKRGAKGLKPGVVPFLDPQEKTIFLVVAPRCSRPHPTHPIGVSGAHVFLVALKGRPSRERRKRAVGDWAFSMLNPKQNTFKCRSDVPTRFFTGFYQPPGNSLEIGFSNKNCCANPRKRGKKKRQPDLMRAPTDKGTNFVRQKDKPRKQKGKWGGGLALSHPQWLGAKFRDWILDPKVSDKQKLMGF